MDEVIGLQATVISARVDLKMDEKLAPIIKTVDAIKAHQEQQNGWIEQHTLKIEANEDDISELQVCVDGAERFVGFLKKRWYAAIVVAILFIWGVILLDRHVGVVNIIEDKTGVDLIDEPRGN